MSFLSSCSTNNDTNTVGDGDGDGDIQTYVKVYKTDNSIHCRYIGISLDAMELDLINLGVGVVCCQKGHDGAVRPIPPLRGSKWK